LGGAIDVRSSISRIRRLNTDEKRYFSMLGRVGVLSAMLALPLVAGTTRIYVTNRGGTTVDVIDPETNKIVDVIKGIESPEVVRFSLDGKRLYITSRGDDNVLDVIDRASGKSIKKVPLSGWANEAVVTTDGKLILVCIWNTTNEPTAVGALDIIDATILEKVKSIPVTRGLHDMAVTRDGRFAAAGSPLGHFLAVFDLQKMELAWQVEYDQGIQPLTIESGPDGAGRRIFAQLGKSNGFSVVDFATHKEVARITVPDDPTGFDRGCEGVSHGIAVAPDDKTLWVASAKANAVFAYSLPDIKLQGHVSLPELKVPGKEPQSASPSWITLTPDSKTVYVTTCAIDSVFAIDAKTMKQVARISTGHMPDRASTFPSMLP
jgi:YVTN family beta-propeller protein